MNLVEELDDFLKKTKDGREVKRILAAKLAIQGKCHKEIENLLKVSSSFISKWKNAAIFQGVERLKMQYKGGKSYLRKIEKQKVIEWLRGLDYCRLGDLQISKTYDLNYLPVLIRDYNSTPRPKEPQNLLKSILLIKKAVILKFLCLAGIDKSALDEF